MRPPGPRTREPYQDPAQCVWARPRRDRLRTAHLNPGEEIFPTIQVPPSQGGRDYSLSTGNPGALELSISRLAPRRQPMSSL